MFFITILLFTIIEKMQFYILIFFQKKIFFDLFENKIYIYFILIKYYEYRFWS